MLQSLLLEGDALTKLHDIPSDSIDLILTDPPYGYSFMNKDWDKAVVDVQTWKECLRVLKAGAFAFIMSSPRQDVLCKMMLNLIDAGFRTDFSSIYWTYASGFPKAADVSKLVDKREGVERQVIGKYQHPRSIEQGKEFDNSWGEISNINNRVNNVYGKMETPRGLTLDITKPATEQAKKLEGSYAGFQPKPAVELILVVMKPLSEKTFVDQALSNGKGITWLDDCRIPYQSEYDKDIREDTDSAEQSDIYSFRSLKRGDGNDKGRFPANILVEDDVLNDGRIIKSQGTTNPKYWGTLEKGYEGSVYSKGLNRKTPNQPMYGDSGSFSRYFSLDAWWAKTLPFLIVPKASKAEKGNFCNHPTVKPLKLMSYLITMGSRENDTILDPFCGSGTTLIAAHILNRKWIGIEINPEYVEIARKRLEPYLKQERLVF